MNEKQSKFLNDLNGFISKYCDDPEFTYIDMVGCMFLMIHQLSKQATIALEKLSDECCICKSMGSRLNDCFCICHSKSTGE